MAKTRVVVIHSDLEVLSRIYLGLLHRHFRVETATEAEAGLPLMRKLRPQLVVLDRVAYETLGGSLKIPAIVYLESGAEAFPHPEDVFILRKPVQVEELAALAASIVY